MGFTSSAPKNIFQKSLTENTREASNPPDEAERIGYGIISEINYNTSQVRVKKYTSDGRIGDELTDGFVPISTPIEVVHHLFGALREGLFVRYYWKGKLVPKNIIVEVIGDEDFEFLKKKPLTNEIGIGPWKIFS